MLELRGKYNIFDLPQSEEAICVTTNGIVKPNGHAVMGAGIALQANKKFNLSEKLGMYISQYGNRAFNLGKYQRCSDGSVFTVFSFPTKHDFREDSDINLICKSAQELVQMCDKFGITKCYLPPVGCGCGNLNYENTVRPWVSQILDNRFIVVLKK